MNRSAILAGGRGSTDRAGRAVVFDLDGTITRPILDFAAIRAELGLGPEPILETLEMMDAGSRAAAEAVLLSHERHAAENCELHDGAIEMLDALRERGYGLALLTRNSRESVQMVLDRHGIVFEAIRTREDGAIKPSPEPVLALCRAVGADPRASWLVGDYRFDIEAGRSAGTTTVLMIGEKDPPDYAHLADHVIRRLPELIALVDRRYQATDVGSER